MVIGIAEVAYAHSYKIAYPGNDPLAVEFFRASHDPTQTLIFCFNLSLLPQRHDVHIDLEEKNSEFIWTFYLSGVAISSSIILLIRY